MRDTPWPMFGGGADFAHYSELTQITPANVNKLQVAWTYELGNDISVSNPLMMDGKVFLIGSGGAIVALDPATGKEIWKAPRKAGRGLRGLTYWSSPDGKDTRIIYARDEHLRALDARTGAQIEGFDVDLRQGVDDRDPATINRIQPSAPGVVFGDLIIIGAVTGEDYGAPPGDIRAYNVKTGKHAWTFHTIPRNGQPGSETWPKDARQKLGGANDWTGFSLDEKRGIVYAVTGSSTYDFWGVDREGSNRFANSILALDARTGKLIWDFQTVHHDLWDWDIPSPPVLLTVDHGGRKIDSVVIAGKTGFLYAFDRVTGKPLWPIEERPVPKSHVPGEKAWPTQPFPTKLKPFTRQTFTIDDIDPTLPADEREPLIAQMKAARNEGLFTPPDTKDVVQMPGNLGATNWGMLFANPKKGMAYVISTDIPSIIKLTQADPRTITYGATPLARGDSIYLKNCALCHGFDRNGSETAPSLVNISERLTPEQMASVINQGRGHMPAFPWVAGSTMTDILAYLVNDRSADGRLVKQAAAAYPEKPEQAEADRRWRTDYGYVLSKTTSNPMIKPPWSQLTAYDLNTGDIVWQRPIGTDTKHPRSKDGPTGLAPARVGSLITASGLIFVGTGRDQTLHAIEANSGKTVWTSPLPGAAAGLPSMYSVRGRQFLLVPAASSRPSTAPGQGPTRNAFVAYALPAGR
ncbi:PQQ-binding-like beta-propeller repeat protein [Phenylobacterium deserti]|nr:PQQ-binding-like beta-propeller repeat protein [Phenylobacterium deserti]